MSTRFDPFSPGSPYSSPEAVSDATGQLPVVPRVAASPKPAAPLADEPGPAPADLPLPVADPDDPPAPDVVVLRPLSHLADVLHQLACGCAYGSDVDGHGVDFEALAVNVRGAVIAETVGVKHPVEAKVWAGTGGALAASLGLAFITALLDQLDVIDALGGGTDPWVGWVVMFLGMALPAAASFLRAYRAEHTARPADVLPTGLAPVGQGDGVDVAPHAVQGL